MVQKFDVQYRRSVKKDLRRLSKVDLTAVVKKIQALVLNPRPVGVAKLQGSAKLYRVRSGDYRIIYEIHDNKLVIIVVKIGHRSHIYD